MTILFFLIAGVICVLFAIGILVLQNHRLNTGVIVVPLEYNGPKQVSVTLHTIIRYALKQSIHMRKFVMQYVFHVMVRLMYHFDILTTKLYAKSRNWFVYNAVKNKGTVPHFWEHLKVYRQEMDQEKEEENK